MRTGKPHSSSRANLDPVRTRGISRVLAAVLAGALSALALASPGQAQDPDLSWPLNDYVPGTVGFIIEDTWIFESWIRVPTPGSQPLCSSMTDPQCEELAQRHGWWMMRLAPPCTSALAWEECIESLHLVPRGGEPRQLTFTGLASGNRFDADPDRGLPTGSSMSLYDDPDSSDPSVGYAAYLGGQMSGREGPFHLSDLSVQVIRYRLTPWQDTNISGRCLWQTSTHCATRLPFPEGTAMRLTVRLHESVTGWLGGRLQAPTIDVDPLTGDLNRVTITGEPVDVPLVSVAISASEVTPEILDYWNRNSDCGNGPCPLNVGSVQSSGPHSADYLRLYAPFLNDTATRSIPTWSVVNMLNAMGNPCLQSTERLLGLVTTNATGYSSSPPSFRDNSLKYQVAGLHYLPSGEVFQGSYDLVMRSDTARCLYGFSDAPVQAEIQVTSDDGVEQVVTTSLAEKDGWLRLSARGFHFSQPTITVKLTSQASEKTILCKKGKKTKKVTGIKPKCPKGWRLVRP